MEDSGIESDSKPTLGGVGKPALSSSDGHSAESKEDAESLRSINSESAGLLNDPSEDRVVHEIHPNKTAAKFRPTSVLQKHLDKQILQTKKFRQREQSLEGLPKKLIPRSRLRVPKGQVPVVMKTDSHPLVSWESDSDDEIDYHPISKSAKEITEQLIKDGYNLDLTPDDEDLDLIPPKPLTQRCVCCSLNCMCVIQ